MLIEDIAKYLAYLKNECCLSVSAHFRAGRLSSLPKEAFSVLLPYNAHHNPYCMQVKKCRSPLCIARQHEIYAGEHTPRFHLCHAGVYEYIHPIEAEGEVFGFIAVSGYRKEDTGIAPDERPLWEAALSQEAPPAYLSAVIPPLAHMLKALFSAHPLAEEDEFSKILAHLAEYHTTVTLDDIAHRFHRSRSYVSRLFNERAGCSLRAYGNRLKLTDAEVLLTTTALSVTEIAYAVGFGDTSYFIKLFREKHGVSPLQYQKTRKTAVN